MHRIDSVNKRPDLFGPGKAGYHDNSDLSGQDATYLTPEWLNSVQEELAGIVEATGAALNKSNNGQLLTALHAIFASDAQLTEVDDRLTAAIVSATALLQGAILAERNAERDRLYPVGTGIYISYSAISPAAVLGFGTWQLISKGRSLVGLSDSLTDPGWAQAIGGTAGEYEHTMTGDELFQHVHEQTFGVTGLGISNSVDPSTTGGTDGYATTVDYIGTQTAKAALSTKPTGEGRPFNIIQPSLVVAVWLRVG